MDPLSHLLGKKKEAEKAATSAPKADPSKLGGSLGNPLDVGASLAQPPRESINSRSEPQGPLGGGYPTAKPSAPSAPPLASTTGPVSPPRAGGSSGGGTSATSPGQGAAPGGAAASFDDILPGEKVHLTLKNCFLLVANPLCEVRGRLLVTNYRMKFQTPKGSLREELRWMQDAKYFDVPMGAVEEIKEEKSQTVTGMTEFKLNVKTKDQRMLKLLPSTEEDCRGVLDALAAFSTPGNPTLLFAFKHAEETWAKPRNSEEPDGWHIYDPAQEYARMGVETELIPCSSSPWQVKQINREYGLCSTYPAMLVLPRKIGDQELRAVAAFRKRGRLPAMSWCGGPEMDFASIWRCSQTTEGLMGQKCMEDQMMVECIRRGMGKQDRDLLVIDLRPWKSAWANKAGGGGFEGYPRCQLVFGGIDNIHAVRDAWKAMGAAVSNVVEGEVGSWWKDVANSSWYDYMGAIMQSTLRIVKEVSGSHSNCMVHCSDGWDRTAQTTSLAMLCLDSHYRTQAGFLQLIQKEWCSFGHRFRTRLALGEQPTSEYSPVFIQWLDCVYQIQQQFPNAFEWTSAVLIRLAHEVLSNRYGTFLCDNERERHQKVKSFAISVWSVLLRPEELSTWQNPNYTKSKKPLAFSVCQGNYMIWEDYWFRFHPRSAQLRVAEAILGAQAAFTAPAASPPVASSGSAEIKELAPPADPLSASIVSVAAAPPSMAATLEDPLFRPEELTTAKAEEAKRKPLFQDDDDEDVFAKPSRKPTETKEVDADRITEDNAAAAGKAAEEAAGKKAQDDRAAEVAAADAAAAARKVSEEAAARKAEEEAAAVSAAVEEAAAKKAQDDRASEEAAAKKAEDDAAAARKVSEEAATKKAEEEAAAAAVEEAAAEKAQNDRIAEAAAAKKAEDDAAERAAAKKDEEEAAVASAAAEEAAAKKAEEQSAAASTAAAEEAAAEKAEVQTSAASAAPAEDLL